MIVRIIAAVVDTQQVVLYKEDGSTIEIPQGDPRIRGIIDAVLPVIGRGGTAEVDLSMPTLNTYKDFEEKTNGLVKFWRVAKKAVANLFTEVEEVVAPTGQFGSLPTPVTGEVVNKSPEALALAVDEIISQAQPISDPAFSDADTTEEHTIVAQVGGKLIPGAENLKDQFAYSVKGNSTIGMENFMKRISAVIEKRSHSVQDLLRFMERGDLPIADDGTIIAYKILRSNHESGVFVDCHTGRVPQKVGSYVCVDESLVDRNRANECSNGLHIARRGYIGSFGGDVCTLVKVAPEDVVTVPHRDANKVRVCGYHIIGLLDPESFQKLKSNRPMTDNPKVARMLGNAIAGNHIRKVEEVRITQQRGGGIKINPYGKDGRLIENKFESKPANALDDITEASISPKEVEKAVVAATEMSRGDKAKALFTKATDVNLSSAPRLAAAKELQLLKKNAKVGWDKLGVNGDQVSLIIARLEPTPEMTPVVARAVPAPKVDQTKAVDDIIAKSPQSMTTASKAKTSPVKAEPTQVLTRSERARKFFNDKDIKGLKAFKQKSKVSWTALGFTPKEVDTILKG